MTWTTSDAAPRRVARLLRIAIYGVFLLGLGIVLSRNGGVGGGGLVWAQAATESLEEPAPAGGAKPAATDRSEPETASPTAPASGATDDKVPDSLWEMYVASGVIGYVITLLSVVALGFAVEHFLTIRHTTLMPEAVVEELDRLIQAGELAAARDFCAQPGNVCLFTQVVLAGLERYLGSEFGFVEYKSAMEEEGEEQTSRLYRKTEVLGVIGAIAPMLGLLGTVQGMILGFNTIAATGGTAKPEDLAASISLALVTTFEGLVVAIPAMVAFSYFRNRIDSLVAEAGKGVERVLTPLSRKRG